jgi:hypothetical protein
MAGRARRRSRSVVAFAASILVHLAVLVLVVASLPRGSPPPEPRSFEVELQPPPLHRLRTVPRLPARPLASRATAKPPTAPAAPSPLTSPALPAPAPSPTPGEDQAGRAKLAALLRGSVGCSEADFLHMTQQERDHCARWIQAHINLDAAIPAPIAPEKRAWFDASLAARATLSHPPGAFCGVLINGLKLIKPKAPPHALQLGSLPCFVIPPKFTFTEEADVETPSRQASGAKALNYTPSALVTSDKGFSP